jgi:hypothetical protein
VFYEVLHFRHLWALLGLGAGIDPGAAPVEREAVHRRTGTHALWSQQQRTAPGETP